MKPTKPKPTLDIRRMELPAAFTGPLKYAYDLWIETEAKARQIQARKPDVKS